MTHRHKNQADEYAAYEAAVHKALDEGRMADALNLALHFHGAPDATATPTDSNHGSRTDSNTREGEA